MFKFVIISMLCVLGGQSYLLDLDQKCRCLCPPLDEYSNYYEEGTLPKLYCNCYGIAVKKLPDEKINGTEPVYCTRCECKDDFFDYWFLTMRVTIILWLAGAAVARLIYVAVVQPIVDIARGRNRRRAADFQDWSDDEADDGAAMD